jgi:hypothetical protein
MARQAQARSGAATVQSRNRREPSVKSNEVAQVAYTLFERRGRVHGFDQQDWLEAERLVKQGRRRA